MRGTLFYKMNGSGNDFVMLDGRAARIEDWSPAQVRAICDRRRGVGADGLVVLTPASPEAVRMSYWNSDGSRGAMCGNAALCSGRLARHLELISTAEFCLLTDAGSVRVLWDSSSGTAEINLPEVDIPGDFTLVPRSRGEHWMTFLSVGVPHLVIRVDDIEMVEPEGRGRSLRYDPNMGSEGANVNFVSPATRDQTWLIRTYERGVEGETLACGTGTVAAAVTLANRGEATLPLRFRSRGGSELTVRGRLVSGHASDIWLGGEGHLVYRGIWEGI